MGKIKVAIAGVGNCASAIVQGIHYYSERGADEGLTYWKVGKYTPEDVEFVAAFDVSARKVGKDLSQAILQAPNNTVKIFDVPSMGVSVKKGPLLDGLGKYLKDVVPVSSQKEANVVEELERTGAEILVNYLPVGSTKASHTYAEAAIEAGAAFINAIPVFIASDPGWAARFARAKLPCAGDDVMSQVGATVLHKTLVKMA
ncbi:MAG TPA: inositol-3-phosphate synthase, partial [Nitrososphaerales archaeon]|nr:inositol-3-phosphate synthase [Nitrososphaerales archaeon]